METANNFIKRHRFWLAPIAGTISATGFAPYNLWPLTIAAFALLIHWVAGAPNRKSVFLIGWLFGVGHFTLGNDWIAVAFTFQAKMPVWLGYFAVVALALYLAIFPALAMLGGWSVGNWTRRRGGNATIPFVIAISAMWIITEWMRSWVFSGFAWNPLSAISLSAFGGGAMRAIGSYGLSGFVLLYAAICWGLFAALLNKSEGKINFKAIFARLLDLTLLSLLTAFLGWIGSGSPIPQTGQPQAITIAQPNISQAEKHRPSYNVISYRRLAENSQVAGNRGPRLILWPEAAVPDFLESGYPYRFYQFQTGENAETARRRLASLLHDGDILITGGSKLEIDKQGQLVGARNSMIAINDGGAIIGSYDKSHLVPYGEYLPVPWLLRPLGLARLVPGDLDFWPGSGAQTLKLGSGRPNVGFQICYEIIFSGRVTDRSNRPDFIFNGSNDAWFGPSGPPQHLIQARMRAIEEGLPVLRATPTGISAVIDANGAVLKSLPMGVAGQIDATLPPAHSETIFARFGNIIPVGMAILMLAFALLPVVMRLASR